MPQLRRFVESQAMAQPRTLESPLLVGRDDLLTLAEQRIQDARSGRGGLLMLAGEAGIGKTRLRKSIMRQSVLAGFRVAGGDLAPQDNLVPLAAIHEMARSLPREFGDLGPRLLALHGGKGNDSLASRRILVREVAEAIVDAIDRPTALAFEDLQWADELTLEVIGDLARLGRDKPLLLVVVYRLDELPVGSIHREWRARLLTQRLAEELRLERLSPADTALVTTLILGTGLPASREVAEAVYERTNGIPLHIEELLAVLGEEVTSDGRAIRDVAVPDTIEDAVLARTGRLSEDARAVARAASVMGRCFAPEVLAGIMDRPIEALDQPLRELVDTSILLPFEYVDRGYYDFRHQLLRDALYDTVPPTELRRLHARAGEFGAELVGANEIHASQHFERAGLRAQAFRAALSGAHAAEAVSSRRESFELYRRAIANMPEATPAAEKAAVYEAFSLAASSVDNVPAIEEAGNAARRYFQEAGDALGAARSLLTVAYAARKDMRPRSERERVVDEVEAELMALGEVERASALSELRYLQAVMALEASHLREMRARLRDARALAVQAGQDPIDIDFFEAMADVLGGEVDAGLGTMLDMARRARDDRLESTGVTAYRNAAIVANRVMEYATAETGIREGMRYADEVEQSYCRHIMATTSAHVAWAGGRWDEAVQIAELELVEPASRRATLGARDTLAYVALGRGLVDRARSLLDTSLAISRPAAEIEHILPALWGHAEAALIAGEPERALDHCEEALELARRTGERPLFVPFVVTGVRAALSARKPDAAERWLARATPHLNDWVGLAGPAIAHGEGLIRLAGGSLVAARTSLEAAVAGWDARGRIWESTWARIDLATCLLRSNRYVDAARVITDVTETARRLGSQPLQARAEELQRQARGRGSDEEAWYPLTVREFEVARHIAEGMTNAQIATELFLSPKTVSAHVEHILAKLGASRRAEIASWVATVAQPAAV
jgi:DNA-binding CsgD family transcriptional regulator